MQMWARAAGGKELPNDYDHPKLKPGAQSRKQIIQCAAVPRKTQGLSASGLGLLQYLAIYTKEVLMTG